MGIGCPDHRPAPVLLQVRCEWTNDAFPDNHLTKVGFSGSRGKVCSGNAVHRITHSHLAVGLKPHGIPEMFIVFLRGRNVSDLVDRFHYSYLLSVASSQRLHLYRP